MLAGAIPHLQFLDLAGNRISSAGAGEISTCMKSHKAGLRRVRTLELSQNIIDDSGAHHLASGLLAGECIRLETLRLNNNLIGTKGAINLFRGGQYIRTKASNRLQLISLRNNKVRMDGVKKLGAGTPGFFVY